jgi:hypothetical protein
VMATVDDVLLHVVGPLTPDHERVAV